MPTEKELFSAIDALLEQVPSDVLPSPAERRRLREAAGLSQTQIATALGTRRESVGSWEAGQREPRPPQRAAYARLLEGLAQRFPTTPAEAAAPPVPDSPPAPDAVARPATSPTATDDAATSTTRSTAPRSAAAARSTSTSRRPAARKTVPAAPPAAPAVDPRFAHGPLGVLDGDGSLYCTGGLVLECPASTVPELVE